MALAVCPFAAPASPSLFSTNRFFSFLSSNNGIIVRKRKWLAVIHANEYARSIGKQIFRIILISYLAIFNYVINVRFWIRLSLTCGWIYITKTAILINKFLVYCVYKSSNLSASIPLGSCVL